MSLAEYEYCEEIKELKKLVQNEKNLYVGDGNEIIMRYLHFSNFDVKKAFAKMKAIYKLKSENEKWFATTIFSEKQKNGLSFNIHCLLKDRDQLGRRVYIIKLGRIPIGQMEPWENFQIDDLWLELAMDEPETQKKGLVYIIDMKQLSWSYLKYFTPHNCKIASMKAEGLPIQRMEYHVVNSGLILNGLVSIVFPFLNGSTKDNIHFHRSNWESLHKFVSSKILPMEYGGEKPAIDYDELRTYLFQNEKRLRELVEYGYRKEIIHH